MGPAWKGMYLRDVLLDDGTTVIADEEYLIRSIKDPTAQQVKGYSIMPPNTLTDAQIAAIVEYIKAKA
jgi:cytochrome c oxidase subunit 2